MNPQIPIYIVNLKRNPERRLFIQRQLDAFNLNYQFVDAVDKYDLKFPEDRIRIAQSLGIDESILENKYNAILGYVQTRDKRKVEHERQENANLGPFACLLSHIKIYDLIIKNDIGTACILEDDGTLLPTFPKILKTAAKLEWDILMLASLPSFFPPYLIQSKHIKKSIRIFDRELLFFNSRSRDYLIKGLLKIYDCSSRLHPKRSGIFEKALQEYDTRYSEIIKIIASGNCCLSLVTCKQRMKYRQLQAHLNMYISAQFGGFPEKSSLDWITDHHCIAKPEHKPFSTMAYLVKQSTAMKWKCKALDENPLVIDEIPWELYRNEQVKLRLITPPCITVDYNYYTYSGCQARAEIMP